MSACIRACSDCADICTATYRVATRRTAGNVAVIEAQLRACIAAGRIAAIMHMEGAEAIRDQDALHLWRTLIGEEQVVLCLVADGHGGTAASDYVALHLLKHVVDAAAGDGCSEALQRACGAAFERS